MRLCHVPIKPGSRRSAEEREVAHGVLTLEFPTRGPRRWGTLNSPAFETGSQAVQASAGSDSHALFLTPANSAPPEHAHLETQSA